MFRSLLTGLIPALFLAQGWAEEDFGENSVEIPAGASAEQVIELAASVRPSPRQLAWQELEFTCFVHFGPNTFTDREWGTGTEDPAVFAPSEFDATQWVHAAQAAGMSMMMLTVKHHDGFCLWDSRYTAHGTGASPLGEAGRDIFPEVVEACRAAGIKVGVYLSPADLYQMEEGTPEGWYGNDSSLVASVIPTNPDTFHSDPSQARHFDGPRFEHNLDDYNRYFMNQLYELLTEYGEIEEVWFDGANPKPGSSEVYDRAAWYGMIRELQPNANIAIKGPDVRWCGNEQGHSRQSEWSVVPIPQSPSSFGWGDLTSEDLGSREKLMADGANWLVWYPAEVDTKIRAGWFWHGDDNSLRSVDDLFDLYERTVGGNSVLLLNLSPDRRGLIPELDVERLSWLGKRIEETYGTNLRGAYSSYPGPAAPGEVLPEQEPITWLDDGQLASGGSNRLPVGEQESALAWVASEPITFNRVVLAEPIAKTGQRIESFALDAWIDDSWEEIFQGTVIGYQKFARFDELTSNRVRLRVLQSRGEPSISEFTLHYAAPGLTEPLARRDREGFLSLESGADLELRYTLDGSEPDAESELYEAPIMVPGVTELRAREIGPDDSLGPVLSRRFDLAPLLWSASVLPAGAPVVEGTVAQMIDSDPATTFIVGADQIQLDLGEELIVSGLTYTPPMGGNRGMLKAVSVAGLVDGQWLVLGKFPLDNIVNDPTPRTLQWDPRKLSALRLGEIETVEQGAPLAIAELEVVTSSE